jgi:hypothetical protein
MPRRKVNKAAKIREAFEKLGSDTRPKDLIADLAARRIKVSSAQVSVVKANLNGHAKNGRRGHKANDLIALSDLQAAKKLVESLGSIDKAQTALGVLAKLQ